MIKNKISCLVTSAIGLMFVLLIAQASIPFANAVIPSDASQNNMSPEQLQNMLDSLGISIPLGSVPLSNPQGGPDTGGQMLSQQPSESDDGDATEEQVSEEEQYNTESMDTNDEDDDSEGQDE
jgi:hypothetical protein